MNSPILPVVILYENVYDIEGRVGSLNIYDFSAYDDYLLWLSDPLTNPHTAEDSIDYGHNPVTSRIELVRTPTDGTDTEIKYDYDELGLLIPRRAKFMSQNGRKKTQYGIASEVQIGYNLMTYVGVCA